MEDINRLKVVLAEKKRTAKWLATEIGKDPATISKWCTNTTQPSTDASYMLMSPISMLVCILGDFL